MKLSSTVLFVKNINTMKDFYMNNLDMEIEHNLGSYVVFHGGLALWEPGKEHIIDRNLETISDSNRFELYFEHNDIPALFERLRAKGVEFLHPVHEEPWGQFTIRFFDTEKNLIEAGEPTSGFINRMYKSGMSIKQIEEKTGMPIQLINMMLQN